MVHTELSIAPGSPVRTPQSPQGYTVRVCRIGFHGLLRICLAWTMSVYGLYVWCLVCVPWARACVHT